MGNGYRLAVFHHLMMAPFNSGNGPSRLLEFFEEVRAVHVCTIHTIDDSVNYFVCDTQK